MCEYTHTYPFTKLENIKVTLDSFKVSDGERDFSETAKHSGKHHPPSRQGAPVGLSLPRQLNWTIPSCKTLIYIHIH